MKLSNMTRQCNGRVYVSVTYVHMYGEMLALRRATTSKRKKL